jgi:hypothetical protein
MKLNKPFLKSRGILLSFLCAAFLLTISCSTTTGTRFPAIDDALSEGRFEEALSTVRTAQEEDELSIYNAKNEISFLLDKGLLAHYAGDYGPSSKDLEESEQLIEDAFTQSISDNFASTMLDDPYQADYIGEDFENIYVNIFNALNYYHAGDIDNAIVEIKSLNEKLLYIKDSYEAQKSRLIEQIKDWLAGEETYYTQSALARYLGLLFYRGIGRPDDARIDAQAITEAFAASPSIYTNPLPPELVMRGEICDELEIPKGMARLNALCFTGLSPYKTVANQNPVWHKSLTDMSGSLHKSSSFLGGYPIKTLAFRMSPVDRIEIAFDNGKKIQLSLLEHMGKVMQEVYETRENRFRQLTWTAGKRLMATISDGFVDFFITKVSWYRDEPEKVDELIKEKIEKENAAFDVRMTRGLPERAYVGGVNLAPGKYSFTVNYYSGKNLSYSKRHENVAVEAGKLNLIEDYCFKYIESFPAAILDGKENLSDFPGRLPAPTGLKLSKTATKAAIGAPKVISEDFNLSWNAVPGATRYCVYWRVPGGTYILNDITADTQFECSFLPDYARPSLAFKVMAVSPEGYGLLSEAVSE